MNRRLWFQAGDDGEALLIVAGDDFSGLLPS
jgi:hypothetical protein